MSTFECFVIAVYLLGLFGMLMWTLFDIETKVDSVIALLEPKDLLEGSTVEEWSNQLIKTGTLEECVELMKGRNLPIIRFNLQQREENKYELYSCYRVHPKT